jgi:hypothetical protein
MNKQKGSIPKGWLYLLSGFLFIVFGVINYFQGGFYNWGVYVPVTKLTAIIVMLFGAFSMWFGYKNITSENAQVDKYLKCIGCGRVYHFHEVPDRKCTDCSLDVEKIEGFFERHPEFSSDKDLKIESSPKNHTKDSSKR